MIKSEIPEEEFREFAQIWETSQEDWRNVKDKLVKEVKRCRRRIDHLEAENRRLKQAIRDSS